MEGETMGKEGLLLFERLSEQQSFQFRRMSKEQSSVLPHLIASAFNFFSSIFSASVYSTLYLLFQNIGYICLWLFTYIICLPTLTISRSLKMRKDQPFTQCCARDHTAGSSRSTIDEEKWEGEGEGKGMSSKD